MQTEGVGTEEASPKGVREVWGMPSPDDAIIVSHPPSSLTKIIAMPLVGVDVALGLTMIKKNMRIMQMSKLHKVSWTLLVTAPGPEYARTSDFF